MSFKRTHDLVGGEDDEVIEVDSLEAIPDVLDLHGTNITQVAIDGARFLLVPPHQALDHTTGKIYFNFTTDNNVYLDGQNSLIYIGSKIVDRGGNPINVKRPAGGGDEEHNPDANVLFVNGINHAWFKNIEVKINGQVVDYGDNMYMYRGDLENRLSFNRQAKESSLYITGWDEEANPFDDLDAAYVFPDAPPVRHDERNPALMRRFLKTTGGKTLWTIGKIHSDIFDQEKLLPDNSRIEIALDRNPTSFVCLSHQPNPETKYSARIDDIALLIKVNHVNPQVSDDIKSVTQSGKSMRYPIRRVKMASFTHDHFSTEINKPELLHGETEIPSRIFLAFVLQSARGGAFAEDPFNYQHFDLRSLCLKVGGEAIPMPNMPMNFSEGKTVLPLFSLLYALDAFMSNEDIGIDMYNYPVRNVIFGFDLKGVRSEAGKLYTKPQHKTISLEARLDHALAHPITCIIYAEFDAEIEITPDQRIVRHLNA